MKKSSFALLILLLSLLKPMLAYSDDLTKDQVADLQQKAKGGDLGAMNQLSEANILEKGSAEQNRQAFYWAKRSAEAGNPVGERLLSLCYGRGIGVKRSDAKYRFWAMKASDQGDPWAQFYLGSSYMDGIGAHYAKAKGLLTRSAEKGNPVAENLLGVMYERGFGVKTDPDQAMQWFVKSSEAGYFGGSSSLYEMYEYGKGVPKDETEAARWQQKAKQQECQDPSRAQYLWLGAYSLGDEVAHLPTMAEMPDPKPLIEKGKSELDSNPEDAFLCFKEAARIADVKKEYDLEGSYYLAVCYENGRGTKKDIKEAIDWYSHATSGPKGIEAREALGLIHENDKKYKDYEKAKDELTGALVDGSPAYGEYAYNLGEFFEEGYAGEDQKKNCSMYYFLSASKGYAKGQYKYGTLVEAGLLGSSKKDNEVTAVGWYLKAADQAYEPAQEAVNRLPEAVKTHKEWPAKLKAAQQAMKDYQTRKGVSGPALGSLPNTGQQGCNPGFPYGIYGPVKLNIRCSFNYTPKGDAILGGKMIAGQIQDGLASRCQQYPYGPQFTFVDDSGSADLTLLVSLSGRGNTAHGDYTAYWAESDTGCKGQSGSLFHVKSEDHEPTEEVWGVNWAELIMNEIVTKWYDRILRGWVCN